MSTENAQDFSQRAIDQAGYALRWIGEEPIAVSAPVDAHVATTYAVLALMEQVQALTSEVRALRRGERP